MIKFLIDFFASIQVDNKDVISAFQWGDFYKAWSSGTASYPFLNAFANTKPFKKGMTTIDLTVSISDIVREDESNLNDVENSTLELLRDVYNLMRQNLPENLISISDNATSTFFVNNGGDNVAGHFLTVSIDIFEGSDLCNNILKLNTP